MPTTYQFDPDKNSKDGSGRAENARRLAAANEYCRRCALFVAGFRTCFIPLDKLVKDGDLSIHINCERRQETK